MTQDEPLQAEAIPLFPLEEVPQSL
jgi:hypothetical protein